MQHTKQEIRDRILQSAIEEFEEKGYADASLRYVVAKAESSLGNLYRYYANKEALFSAITSPIIEQCIFYTESIDFSYDKLPDAADKMVDYFAYHRREFNILQKGPFEYYNGFLTKFGQAIADKLRVLYNTNGRKAPSNPDFFDLLAVSYIGGMRLVMEKYVDSATTKKYLLEYLRMLFGDFSARINNL